VRNLAARSAEASKETADLIESSMKKARKGSIVGHETAASLQRMVEQIKKVANFVNEIARASKEQALGFDQVNAGLEQIEKVTQKNTANACEISLTAEELDSQSEKLKEMLSQFKLKNNDTTNIRRR
jgi:methyl-accepting chemotaxis protein